MPEAYEGEGNCVVRQLCAMYGLEREDVEAEFNDIGDWSEGITARQILEWCGRRGTSAFASGIIAWWRSTRLKNATTCGDLQHAFRSGAATPTS